MGCRGCSRGCSWRCSRGSRGSPNAAASSREGWSCPTPASHLWQRARMGAEGERSTQGHSIGFRAWKKASCCPAPLYHHTSHRVCSPRLSMVKIIMNNQPSHCSGIWQGTVAGPLGHVFFEAPSPYILQPEELLASSHQCLRKVHDLLIQH